MKLKHNEALTGTIGDGQSLAPQADDHGAHASVALVNMPFAAMERPSIQCGLLKASLVRAGHRACVHYLNVELAAVLGRQLYRQLSQVRANLLMGEWLFSTAAFGDFGGDREGAPMRPALRQFCDEAGISHGEIERLRHVTIPEWVESWARRIDWTDYDLVGFSSTFEQNNPSFAMAQAIKRRSPDVSIIFGGANFDGEMGREYVRKLTFIDYAVIGEGDHVLPQIADRIAAGEDPCGLAGVVCRRDGEVAGIFPAPPIADIGALPDPDYDEYFECLARLYGAPTDVPSRPQMILVESSRGCWWGQKHHCTFCGLNAQTMTFRSKTPQQAYDQLSRLASKYHTVLFEAVDNIMDHRYVDGLTELIIRERLDFQLFYEVKANLKREQLKALSRAGVRSIQPGIESLNSHILSLMRKGTTMLQNIACLKWARYYGIQVAWNVLTGFPGESVEDYRSQVAVLPALHHLQPPNHSGRIWLERFSPYYTDASLAVTDVRPLESYAFIYPESQIDIDKAAYFFEYSMPGVVAESEQSDLHRAIGEWKESWKRRPKPSLTYERGPDWIQIFDARGEEPKTSSLHGVAAKIYDLCSDAGRSVGQLHAAVAETAAGGVDEHTLRAILDELTAFGYIVADNDHFLSLALPINTNW